MATDGCRRIDGGMQPKPAIFALSRACIARGTGSSNPTPSPAVPQRRNRIRVRPAMNKHEDGCCGAGGAIDVELLDLAGAVGDALRLADAAARQLAVAGPAPDQHTVLALVLTPARWQDDVAICGTGSQLYDRGESPILRQGARAKHRHHFLRGTQPRRPLPGRANTIRRLRHSSGGQTT